MENSESLDLSIVIPIHNESQVLEKNITHIISQLLARNIIKFEIILSENGSTDNTVEIANKLCKNDSRIRLKILENEGNYGKALKKGLLAARGKFIINFDIDFYDIEFTEQALALERFGYDIIVASKNSRLSKDLRSWTRRMISRMYKYVLYYTFALHVSDTHGIKAWRNDEEFRKLIETTKHTREIFDSELIIRSQYNGRKLLELPVEIRETRKSVTSILPRALRGFTQIIKLWFELRFQKHIEYKPPSNNSAISLDKEFFYNDIADEWLEFMNMYEVGKRMRLIKEASLKIDLKNKNILDAGCGIGLFSKMFEELGAKVTSLDVGIELLNEVAKRCNTTRVVGSLHQLPFADNEFDVTISTEVLEHLTDPYLGMLELIRVTKPGGKVIITTPNKSWRFAVTLANILHVRKYQGNENWLFWYDLKNYAEKNGLHIDESFGFNIIPVFIKPFHPIIDFLDKYGKFLHPVMVNSFILGTKK